MREVDSGVLLTRVSLSNPVAVVVACLLLTIFGLISLSRLPIQLTPDIERPEITTVFVIDTQLQAGQTVEIMDR